MLFRFQHRCSGLCVPAAELRQIALVRVLKTFHPVFDRGGLPVMAGEIKIGRLAITFRAGERVQHADHLGTFFVDRRGIEIVDGDVALRLHRMGERTRIFLKLAHAQKLHILDPLDAGRTHIGRKTLVTENRQPFLQGKLEPVAAGDAVASPVVEIFMGDHAFNAGVIIIRRGFGARQQQLVVEDVQALVLHRAEIEGGDRDDHEDVEIVFAAIFFFVPFHRALERIHRVSGFGLVAVLDEDAQIHLAPAHGDEFVLQHAQIARHQREQITGFRERIVPHHEMASARQIALFNRVAVRQQHRIFRLVGFDAGGEHGQIVRPVEEIGDAAEAFSLALGAENTAGEVKPFQCGVLCR